MRSAIAFLLWVSVGAALASAQVKCPVAIEMASQQGKNYVAITYANLSDKTIIAARFKVCEYNRVDDKCKPDDLPYDSPTNVKPSESVIANFARYKAYEVVWAYVIKVRFNDNSIWEVAEDDRECASQGIR